MSRLKLNLQVSVPVDKHKRNSITVKLHFYSALVIKEANKYIMHSSYIACMVCCYVFCWHMLQF